MRRIFSLVLVLCITLVAYADHDNLQKDVVYGNALGQSLLLDVCRPPQPGLHPIALLIHGGGWSTGDKAGSNKPGDGADITPWFKPLSESGFVWFSINYRTAPSSLWPACYEDVKTAVKWIKLHASKFGGDARHIVVIGHSAGGHLAFLLGTEEDPALRVESIVGCAPVTDFEYELPIRKEISKSLQMLHSISKEITPQAHAVLKDTAPINHVHKQMAPFLIIHGQADKTVPIQESINFQAKVQAMGGVCDLIQISGAPHRLLSYTDHDAQWTSKMIAWILCH